MDALLQDFRSALRSLRGSPLLVAASVASLSLGIGASAAIFSAVDTFLLKPLEFRDSDRLVFVWSNNLDRGWRELSSSAPDVRDWQAAAGTIDMAAYTGSGANMSTPDGAIHLDGLQVSPGFFRILGVSPQVGRAFTEDDGRPGAPRVAILSNEVWQQSFGADATVVGRVLNMDGEATEVVGVMPEGFVFGSRNDLWRPLELTGDTVVENRGRRWLTVLGRVHPDATVEGARTELASVAGRLASSFPDSNQGVGVTVTRVQDEWFDEGFRQGSAIAGVAVIFVLLIACANVANLLLARGADREREVALRSAIGAGRGRIVRQFLTESAVLAVAGGILGLGVGYVGMEGIRRLFPAGMPGVNRLVLDGRMILFTAAATAVSVLIFGLAPALQTSRTSLRSALVDGGRGGSGRRGSRLRSGLVMTEIGLSVVLLVSAVLLVKAFVQLRFVDLGFDVDRVATMRLTLPATRYPDAEALRAFQRDLLGRVAALPGVEAAATTSVRPMWGNTASTYAIPGEEPSESGRAPAVNVRYVSPDYFRVMSIRLKAGRAFTTGDDEGAPPVVVINERFAGRHWKDRSPLGERVTIWGADREIVGVVADTRDWGPDDDAAVMLYAPAEQRPTQSAFLMVRTTGDPAAVGPAVRQTVRALDPDQAVYYFATLREVVHDEVMGNLAMAKVLGTLAAIAFLLSAVGVYGVLAYSVARRTQELGIRQSLGADRRDVRALVLRQGVVLALTGIVGGIAVCFATTRLLAFFLYGVSPFDPVAFAGVPLVLLATALAASWLPALRATRVDPIVALRAE